jgi:hypothetical protein
MVSTTRKATSSTAAHFKAVRTSVRNASQRAQVVRSSKSAPQPSTAATR